MKKQYFFIPQWQDSGITNELFNGAWALYDYFRNNYTDQVCEIDINASDKPILENNILGYSILVDQLTRIKNKLEEEQPQKVITIGGGCGIEVPIISYLSSKNSNMKLFWFDAHGDLNSPESSSSKHFHGMPLRFLTEKQNNEIDKIVDLVKIENIKLIGTRDLEPPEIDYIKNSKIESVLCDANYLAKIEENIQPDKPAYIHIDLDVIDPKYYGNVKCPIRKGFSISKLVSALSLITSKMNIVGMSILENTEIDKEKIELLSEVFDIIYKV